MVIRVFRFILSYFSLYKTESFLRSLVSCIQETLCADFLFYQIQFSIHRSYTFMAGCPTFSRGISLYEFALRRHENFDFEVISEFFFENINELRISSEDDVIHDNILSLTPQKLCFLENFFMSESELFCVFGQPLFAIRKKLGVFSVPIQQHKAAALYEKLSNG